ncbi:MAG: hypothetical protein M4579_006408 [Chaenotheca gracillima]|nr:MAG: hypothetical protein M4579_006408 [Chaenotheca gracillima]
MPVYSLHLVTYDRGKRWDSPEHDKPYHWAFFAGLSPAGDTGYTHQLRGMPGSFYYPGAETGDITTSDKLTELKIGALKDSELSELQTLLSSIPIKEDESSKWNCQDWSLEALDKMREMGWIDETYTNDVLKHWLREDQRLA